MSMSAAQVFRQAILPGGTFGLSVVVLVLWIVTSGAPAAAETNDIRVMTFNLRYASDKPPNAWRARRPVVKTLIEETHPDVIGTQEGLYRQVKDIESDLSAYGWIGLGAKGAAAANSWPFSIAANGSSPSSLIISGSRTRPTGSPRPRGAIPIGGWSLGCVSRPTGRPGILFFQHTLRSPGPDRAREERRTDSRGALTNC